MEFKCKFNPALIDQKLEKTILFPVFAKLGRIYLAVVF